MFTFVTFVSCLFTIFILLTGALDTSKIHIVPKHSINDSAMRKAPMRVLNLPFEATFRLQVRVFFLSSLYGHNWHFI